MKYSYTATIIRDTDEELYYCRVPDLPGCITTGDSVEDAIDMITDAASGWLVVAEDTNGDIPAPTPQTELDIPDNAIRTLIRIDTIAYRSATDTRAVRKNVSLPAWMAALAEKRGFNCSQILQDRLMQLFDPNTVH